MRVEIISGNEAGVVKDLPRVEAEVAITTGYAKPVYEPAEAVDELGQPELASGGLVAAGEPTLVGEVVSDFTIPPAAAEALGIPTGADLDADAAEKAARDANSGSTEQSDAVQVETSTAEEAAKVAVVPEGATAEQQPDGNIEGSAAGN